MKRYWGVLILAAGLLLAWFHSTQSQSTTSLGAVYLLTVKASINPITKDYLVHNIERAQREGASLILIQLDTPGGLVSSTKDIVDAMLNSSVPVVVWVGPAGAWAASAGTFITMAAHVASMARGATIGAAHPVNIDGSAPGGDGPDEGDDQSQREKASESGDAVSQKITNFTAEWAREIAKVRGRDPDWAEAAVRSSVTAGAEEALDKKVIDLIANSVEELLNQLNGYTLRDGRTVTTERVPVKSVPMSWREQLLNYLADPNLVYILLLVGIYGLIYEFLSPTIGLGFILGGISLLLAFLGLQILPVNLVGLALILFGVLLMVLDVFTPTHGILTTGGVLALIVGSFTLFEVPDPNLQLSTWNVLFTVGVVTAMFVFIVGKGLLAQKRVPVTGAEGMIGTTGLVKEDVSPKGRVLVKGEFWWATSEDGQPIRAGEEVTVVRMENGRLVVRRRS
jgi:membrane-bound serine protease (ClpP class)